MSATIIEGDILDSKCTYIVHQTNCISQGASGLARAIFNKLPDTNIYLERSNGNFIHKPGQIYLKWNIPGPHIINAMGQFYPGATPLKIKFADMSLTETAELRMIWFMSCLDQICQLNDLGTEKNSIAFPYKIGCGLAGGDWDQYKKAIDDFADSCKKDVFIVKRPEDE
jgi:O-acetyl-ADP-ribose deacetylase (regulator of RNase III)